MALAPDPGIRFEPGDRIVVQGQRDALRALGTPDYLALESDTVALEELISPEVNFAEVTIPSDSRLAGRTVRELDFRHRFHGCPVLAVWRDGSPLRTHLATTQLASGDVLLVHGQLTQLEKMGESPELLVSIIFDPLVYGLEDRLMSCTIPKQSPLVGKTLAESRLGDVFSLGVMGIVRAGEKTLIPPPDERLKAGDRLLVKGRPEDLRTLEGLHELPIDNELALNLEDLESGQVCLAELVLAPRSGVAGKTLPQIHFREKYGMNVMAVMREDRVYRNLRYLPLKFGDALLLHGPRQKLKLLGREPDFIVLTVEAQEAPLREKAPLSALLMGAVAGSVILGLTPIYIAAVAGAVLMVLTRCLSMDEAYRAIEWRAVFLIAGHAAPRARDAGTRCGGAPDSRRRGDRGSVRAARGGGRHLPLQRRLCTGDAHVRGRDPGGPARDQLRRGSGHVSVRPDDDGRAPRLGELHEPGGASGERPDHGPRGLSLHRLREGRAAADPRLPDRDPAGPPAGLAPYAMTDVRSLSCEREHRLTRRDPLRNPQRPRTPPANPCAAFGTRDARTSPFGACGWTRAGSA